MSVPDPKSSCRFNPFAGKHILKLGEFNLYVDRKLWEKVKPITHHTLIGLHSGILRFDQWEFQDPKMEVLYHIRPYCVGIFPYIGLI
jgi:hypothetical protein